MKNLIYTFTISVCFVSTLLAQVRDSVVLPGDNVEVIKSFKTQLLDTEMIPFDLPSIPDANNDNAFNLDYAINPPLPLEVQIQDPTIRPLVFTEEKNVDINHGYLKMGYGNLKSPDLLGQYHYYIEDWFEVGLKGNYYKAQDANIESLRNTDTGLGAYASFFLNEQTKIKAEANGSWDKVNFSNDFIPEIDTTLLDDRKINAYNLGLSFSHVPFQKNKLVLNSELLYSNIALPDSTADKTNENSILIKNYWGKRFGNSGTSGFYLESFIDYTNTNAVIDTNYLFYKIEPYISLKKDRTNILLGVYYDKANTLWPKISVDYDVKNLGLNVLLYSNADSEVNNLKRITSIHPQWEANFIDPANYATYTIKNIGLKLSGQRNLAKYYLGVVRRDHQNHYGFGLANRVTGDLFLQDFNEVVLQIGGAYLYKDWLNFKIDIENSFLDDAVVTVPNLNIDFELGQHLIDKKLRLFQRLFYVKKRDLLTFDSFSNNIVDLNIGADYSISKLLTVYIEGKNLLNKDYFYYPTFTNYGINFHAGAKLVF